MRALTATMLAVAVLLSACEQDRESAGPGEPVSPERAEAANGDEPTPAERGDEPRDAEDHDEPVGSEDPEGAGSEGHEPAADDHAEPDDAGAGDDEVAEDRDGSVGAEAADAPEGEQRITGTLGGDARLENGCVWIDTGDGERYEVLWPDGWEADADPVQLRDPDGEVVAREGDEVRVTGAETRDVATVCQVGTPFEATDVEAG